MKEFSSITPNSFISVIILKNASSGNLGDSFFSNLAEDSVLTLYFLEVSLIFFLSNVAISINIFLVSFLTPESLPPIIPTSAKFSLSILIVKSSESSNSSSFNNSILPLLFAIFISNLLLSFFSLYILFNISKSNICVGLPVSNII